MTQDFWNNCRRELEASQPPPFFARFIKPLRCTGGADALHFTAASNAAKKWAEENLREIIAEKARAHFGNGGPSIFFSADDSADAKSPPILIPISRGGLRADLNFNNFVPGRANGLALAAALQVSNEDGGRASYNPLFICGAAGLGKTHLSHAIGNARAEKRPGANIRHLNANDFMDEVVRGYRNDKMGEFKAHFGGLDMLIVDDIQYLGGDRKRTQEEFFFLFNSFIDSSKPVIVTCDRLPNQIRDMNKRMTTRFSAGLTVSIDPPELELRIAILQRKAENRNVNLESHAARYIADRVKSNVRELEGALTRVIAYADFRRLPITPETCHEALKDVLSHSGVAPSVEDIQKKVADYYGIRLTDIKSPRRSRSVARPRQAAIYLTRQLTTKSFPEIGEAFGGRNHTTALHACKRIESLIKTDSQLEEDIRTLRVLITE